MTTSNGCVKIMRRVLFLTFALLLAMPLYSMSNAYVTISSDAGRIVCLGLDFLIIPDNPFGEYDWRIHVESNDGWTLCSPHEVIATSSSSVAWRVKGDPEDNPED